MICRLLGGGCGWLAILGLTLASAAAAPLADKAPAAFGVRARSYPEPGKILASVNVPAFPGVADGTRLSLDVELRRSSGGKVAGRTTVDAEPQLCEEIILDAADLPSGDYTVAVELHGAALPAVQRASAKVVWPGRAPAYKNIKILNNFVWGLLDQKAAPGRPVQGVYDVRVPCDRWLMVRSRAPDRLSGQVGVSLDSQYLHRHQPGAGRTLESMRFVKAGDHQVQVAADGAGGLERLEVRTAPEIQHSRYPTRVQHIKQGVEYDWEFLGKYILPNVNTIISQDFPESAEPQLREWKERGGKWIAYGGRVGRHSNRDLEASAEVCAEQLAKRPGYVHPLLDGVLVDEFCRETEPYGVYTGAVQSLNARFPGRAFYPYAAGTFGKKEDSVRFARACIEGGGYICWEAYLGEWDNLRSALWAMRRYPGTHITPIADRLPGGVNKIVWVFGAFSFPWPYADGYAGVNYNAYLDMQFQFIATHPTLFGLGGVHIWRSGYCDEERVRWFGRYFRHYCLEGRVDRANDAPYMLTHIWNPDFVDGLKGWTLQPAAADGIRAEQRENFGKFIGRYYRGPDTFAVTRRQADRPNVLSQTIGDLKPGRLYSVKLFTGNYGDLVEGKSRKEVHSVSIEIRRAQLLEGDRYRYQCPFPTRGVSDQFDSKHPFWLNYHWRVFRATGTTAELRLSDWKSPDQPGGPAGRQLLYTFVEVKPYLEE
jgi:hypothetical protein